MHFHTAEMAFDSTLPVAASLPPALLLAALDAAVVGIVIAAAPAPGGGRDHPVVYVNPALERLTGYTRAELLGRDCRLLQGGLPRQPVVDEIRQALDRRAPCQVEIENVRRDGTRFMNELSLSPVCGAEGRVTHYIGVQRDITERTERVREMARLDFLATHDVLTGLANRRAFESRAPDAWTGIQRAGGVAGVAFVDIDAFKAYNDHYGHPAGDVVLGAVARELADHFRRATDVVARYGGEEFVIVGDGEGFYRRVEEVVWRVFSLRLPHQCGKGRGQGSVSVSAGVWQGTPTAGPLAGLSAGVGFATALAAADAAMYRAKQRGGNTCVTIGA